jgi:AcrR family transcriptional regulator
MQLDCIDMEDAVKRDRRAVRRLETEARLVEAATRLFVEHGYAATTLTAVADDAGLAHRTVYLRFPTKADLLQRCLDVAIRGDDAGDTIDERDWVREAMGAPSAEDRIAVMARATATLMARTGRLLLVAQQAEAVEPTIAERAQAARGDTRRVLERFFRAMAADGLLDRGVDVGWLATTGAVVGQPETYVLLSRTVGWTGDRYRRWLETTWRQLAGVR